MVLCAGLLLPASASCVSIPEQVQSLPRGRATSMFEELRDRFEMSGSGSVEWTGDGVTLRGGPGALVMAIAERDYRVRVEVMVEEGGNSGVFVRSKGGIWFPDGVEVQIDPADPKNPTGSIYGRVRSAAPVPPYGEWFTLEVLAAGDRVESWVNGIAGARVEGAPPSGPLFALQAHYPGSVVHFRALTIELAP
jgi:hypothetical protein